MSLLDRLVCFADFFGMTLLALLFLLPLQNCFFGVCLPTLFAAVLNFFLLLTTSAISGTANSTKTAFTRFAAETIYLCKKRIANLQKNLCKCTEPCPRYRPIQRYRMEYLIGLKQPSCNVFLLEVNVGAFSKHQNTTTDTYRYKGHFFTNRVSQVNVDTMKKLFCNGLICRLLIVWYFLQCSVVILFPAVSFEMKGKQRII